MMDFYALGLRKRGKCKAHCNPLQKSLSIIAGLVFNWCFTQQIIKKKKKKKGGGGKRGRGRKRREKKEKGDPNHSTI
jgi:hypothetical protein